jgi:uncharacterized protein (TIGR00290 family)
MARMKEKVLLSWSGGKDAALALYELRRSKAYQVVGLLTTVTEACDRITMHDVRRVLLERQAEALALPLHAVFLPTTVSDEEYGDIMREALQRYPVADISCLAFGEIFLEDVRKYREERLSAVGMRAVLPLWGRDSTQLARSFINAGFKAIITCVDSQYLDGAFVGRAYDEQLLSDLPPSVDPCGENGEFHSFVFDGPIFGHDIQFQKGEVVVREARFYYCDLLPPYYGPLGQDLHVHGEDPETRRPRITAHDRPLVCRRHIRGRDSLHADSRLNEEYQE